MNLLLNIISFAINLAISFLLTPYLIRTVGIEAYGFYPLANSIFSYAQVFTAAFSTMAVRFVMVSVHSGDEDSATKYFNIAVVTNFVIAGVLTLLFSVALIHIEHWLSIPNNLLDDIQSLFITTLLSVTLSIAFDSFGYGTMVRDRMDLLAIRTLVGNIVRVGAIVLLFSLFSANIRYVGVATLISAIFTTSINLYFKHSLLPTPQVNISHFDLTKLREVASSGLYSSINRLGIIIRSQLDILLVNLFFSASVMGDFSIAKTIPIIIASFTGTVVAVFVPEFTSLYARHKSQQLLQRIYRSMDIMTILLNVPIGVLIVFAGEFFSLWTPQRNSDFLYTLSILSILQIVVSGSINPLFNIYSVTNRVKLPAIVTLLFALSGSLVMVLLLKITSFGIWIIPLVSIATVVIRDLSFTIPYSAHCLNLPWHTFYPQVLKGLLVVCVTIAVGYVVRLTIIPAYKLSWLTLGFSFAITALPSMALFALLWRRSIWSR